MIHEGSCWVIDDVRYLGGDVHAPAGTLRQSIETVNSQFPAFAPITPVNCLAFCPGWRTFFLPTDCTPAILLLYVWERIFRPRRSINIA